LPTSNLDPRSEAKIEAALDVLLEGRTAILIAHRLSTAVKADRIVVVDEGHDEPGLRGKPRTRADLRAGRCRRRVQLDGRRRGDHRRALSRDVTARSSGEDWRIHQSGPGTLRVTAQTTKVTPP